MATPADMEQWASLQAPKTKGKPTPEQVRAALPPLLRHRLAVQARRCSPRSRAPPAAPRSPAALAPQIAERKALAERAGTFLKDLSGKLGARPPPLCVVCWLATRPCDRLRLRLSSAGVKDSELKKQLNKMMKALTTLESQKPNKMLKTTIDLAPLKLNMMLKKPKHWPPLELNYMLKTQTYGK